MCECATFHSAADGNLGGFDFLAVMNNVAMNTCAQAFVWICFQFSGYTPRSGVAASYYNVFHCGTARLFSKTTAPFSLPTSNLRGLQLLHPLVGTYYCPSDRCILSANLEARFRSRTLGPSPLFRPTGHNYSGRTRKRSASLSSFL